MSALNVFVGDDEIHIFTDGAGYHQDGRLACRLAKTFALPDISGALASIGNPVGSLAGLGVAMEVDEAEVGDFATTFAKRLRMAAQQSWAAEQTHLDNCAFVVAGFGPAGPAAYLICTFSENGEPAFTARKVAKYCRPYDARMISVAFDHQNPRDSGLRILEVQRRGAFANEAGLVGNFVGGFAHHVRVARSGLTMAAIKHWPDVIGQKIEPELTRVA